MVDVNTQFGGFLTNLGAAKNANANALGVPWKLTHMLIGDANGADPVPAPGQTALVNQVYRAQLNQLYVSPTDDNVLIAELVLPPNVGGWWIRELALEDEDGVFSAVANCAPSYKPVLAQGSGRNQVVRMHVITSGTANIQLKIDPSVVLATRAYCDGLIAAHNAAEDPHPQYATNEKVTNLFAAALKIGDSGIGGDLATFVGNIDDPATVPLGQCFVAASNGTTGTLPSNYGILNTVGFRNDQMLQIFSVADGVNDSTTSILYRTGMPGRPDGTWGPWVDIITSSQAATKTAAELGTSSTEWMSPLRVFQALRSAAASASESLYGVLRIATQDAVNVGSEDDVVVTPKKLKAVLAHNASINLAATGHISLPSFLGGFALCCGKISNSGNGTSYTFSRAFTEVYGVITSSDGNFSTGLELLQVSATTTTGFTAVGAIISPQSPSNVPGWYFAYGK